MNRHIVKLSILVVFVCASQNPSLAQNAHPSEEPEDMNNKIKGIAQGIVDKWVAEGLTVTRDKVEGWLDILDKSQVKGKTEKEKKTSQASKSELKQEIQKPSLDGDFKEVRDTLVNTFTNIGKVKCENCKKTGEHKDHSHNNESPPKLEGKDKLLENLSVEELMQKQDTIKQFMKMEKMSKLAKLASSFSELGKLKDIANLANTLNTLTKDKRDEL